VQLVAPTQEIERGKHITVRRQWIAQYKPRRSAFAIFEILQKSAFQGTCDPA
jgi:hypothetical protein